MSKIIPPIPTVDQLISDTKRFPKIIINDQPYCTDHTAYMKKRKPYYSNIVKRVVASFYVLFGKGLVVRYSEDAYKASEIKTITYE